MTRFQKVATMQRLQPLQNGEYSLKIKIVKNMPNITTLERHKSCSVLKTAPIKAKRFSKSEKLTIDPKAVALEKLSIGSKLKWFKNMPKTTLESH